MLGSQHTPGSPLRRLRAASGTAKTLPRSVLTATPRLGSRPPRHLETEGGVLPLLPLVECGLVGGTGTPTSSRKQERAATPSQRATEGSGGKRAGTHFVWDGREGSVSAVGFNAPRKDQKDVARMEMGGECLRRSMSNGRDRGARGVGGSAGPAGTWRGAGCARACVFVCAHVWRVVAGTEEAESVAKPFEVYSVGSGLISQGQALVSAIFNPLLWNLPIFSGNIFNGSGSLPFPIKINQRT